MAMTETRPEVETPAATRTTAPSAGVPRPAGGLAGLLGTGRHRSIGRLWVGTSLVFLAVTGVLGGVLGAERIKPETYNILNKDNFAQTLSLHGVGGVFLFALPILIGLGTIVVPRQMGAHTIAFPRAAAAAFWGYLVGGGLLVVSYLINGGPYGGNEKGVDLFLVSLAMVVAALVLALVCIATTVLAVRVRGLTLARAPLFAWSMLVAATIWIASLGLLFGVLVLLYVDHRYRLFVFGADDEIAFWLRWTVTQPQVFALAIPVLGFVGDVACAHVRRAACRHRRVRRAVVRRMDVLVVPTPRPPAISDLCGRGLRHPAALAADRRGDRGDVAGRPNTALESVALRHGCPPHTAGRRDDRHRAGHPQLRARRDDCGQFDHPLRLRVGRHRQGLAERGGNRVRELGIFQAQRQPR